MLEKLLENTIQRIALMVILSLGLVLILFIIIDNVEASNPPETICLIIVSGNGGYSQTELSKASSFYDHMLEELDSEDIRYLTDQLDPSSEGPANYSNIEAAFEWLEMSSSPEVEVIIYISDHEKRVYDEIFFTFDDCDISITTMDQWFDLVSCSGMTLILNGERSGLAGPELIVPDRDIFCSMEEDQEFDPDLFNITRGLKDPTADLNNDNNVSYMEAFLKEVINLQYTGQNPVYYDL